MATGTQEAKQVVFLPGLKRLQGVTSLLKRLSPGDPSSNWQLYSIVKSFFCPSFLHVLWSYAFLNVQYINYLHTMQHSWFLFFPVYKMCFCCCGASASFFLSHKLSI